MKKSVLLFLSCQLWSNLLFAGALVNVTKADGVDRGVNTQYVPSSSGKYIAFVTNQLDEAYAWPEHYAAIVKDVDQNLAIKIENVKVEGVTYNTTLFSLSPSGEWALYEGYVDGYDAYASSNSMPLIRKNMISGEVDVLNELMPLGALNASAAQISNDGDTVFMSGSFTGFDGSSQSSNYSTSIYNISSAEFEFIDQRFSSSAFSSGSTLSADGRLAVAVFDRKVYVIDVALGSSTWIGSGDYAFISENGKWVVYGVSGVMKRYSTVTEENVTVLTMLKEKIRQFSVSNDGNSFAFEGLAFDESGSSLGYQGYYFDKEYNAVEIISLSDTGEYANANVSKVRVTSNGEFVFFQTASTSLEEETYGESVSNLTSIFRWESPYFINQCGV